MHSEWNGNNSVVEWDLIEHRNKVMTSPHVALCGVYKLRVHDACWTRADVEEAGARVDVDLLFGSKLREV